MLALAELCLSIICTARVQPCIIRSSCFTIVSLWVSVLRLVYLKQSTSSPYPAPQISIVCKKETNSLKLGQRFTPSTSQKSIVPALTSLRQRTSKCSIFLQFQSSSDVCHGLSLIIDMLNSLGSLQSGSEKEPKLSFRNRDYDPRVFFYFLLALSPGRLASELSESVRLRLVD